MLVKEVMTKDVITLDKNQTVYEACKLYKEFKIGCLIITENNCCAGIVTERDLIERTICDGRDPRTTAVYEIMSTDLKTIHKLDTIEKAIEIMITNNIKKLPVCIDCGIVGIITVTDISRARPDLSKRFIDSWVKAEWVD